MKVGYVFFSEIALFDSNLFKVAKENMFYYREADLIYTILISYDSGTLLLSRLQLLFSSQE